MLLLMVHLRCNRNHSYVVRCDSSQILSWHVKPGLDDKICLKDSFVSKVIVCMNFKAIRYEPKSLNRIIVDKSNCVVEA